MIQLDHCYAKPWNWRPETSFMRPCKTLFVNNKIQSQDITITSPAEIDDSDDIDIVEVAKIPEPIYDTDRARRQMEECESHARASRVQDIDDWEHTIVK